MAVKTKLKKEISKELKKQKKLKLEENRKENAKLAEVIVYTIETCPHSKNLKEALKQEGIKFKEKD